MTYKRKMPEQFQCKKCGGWFALHRYNQEHCIACSYLINTAKSTERARLKRLALKEKQSS
jgi:hypothetical protein